MRNASLLRLESITDMQEEVAEDVPICTLYDMAGKCWHGNALATGRVPWEEATPHKRGERASSWLPAIV